MLLLGYILLYTYIFLFGCCIGSFLNVVALRCSSGESFIRGRSHCPQCGETLHVGDLVPVFSYLFLRGRCRYCHTKISPRYPLTEAVGGILFLICFLWFGFTWKAVNACLLAALLLCVFLVDMDTMTIPNPLVLCFVVPACIDFWLAGFSGIWGRLLGMVVISVPLLLLALLIPGCFGGGDIKLTVVCGFLLGWGPMLLAAFAAVVSCGIISAVRLALKKVKKGDHVAFGPYLAVGILTAYLFYTPVMTMYMSLLGF